MSKDIAQALRSADWSNVSIGNKAIVLAAAEEIDRQRAELSSFLVEIDQMKLDRMHPLAVQAQNARALLDRLTQAAEQLEHTT